MQTTNFWNMQHLPWRQITVFAVVLLLLTNSVHAQWEMNLPQHEEKRYYFGITLSTNFARFQAEHHPKFLQDDSVRYIGVESKPGFGLGLLGTLRLTSHLEARINPHLIFASRSINYSLKYPQTGDSILQQKSIESIYTSFPFQLKFSSDRINNFRVYIIGGGKFEYDLASNSQARKAEDLVKLTKGAFGYEAGLGFHFYFPSFIFSPEIKISNTFGNVHSRDPNLIYSNVIDRMQARMIVISLHLEG
ncbi:MAG: outer membrane beta-barrel protein [Chitinophagaceae bacterium]|nr:outer membrane beta-barrel protein [Chitinophagaceae bacterium]